MASPRSYSSSNGLCLCTYPIAAMCSLLSRWSNPPGMDRTRRKPRIFRKLASDLKDPHCSPSTRSGAGWNLARQALFPTAGARAWAMAEAKPCCEFFLSGAIELPGLSPPPPPCPSNEGSLLRCLRRHAASESEPLSVPRRRRAARGARRPDQPRLTCEALFFICFTGDLSTSDAALSFICFTGDCTRTGLF